ncbi:undecaprenyl-diphosphate phosphatase [Thiohalophilus thiocyanatoxydans]|uniref:Undecaprenyl-diphosphatase n=1 Tax=Thiohalophilus thiocyanatoxydans TaxID=381308 RepID=A0A4R8IEZ7_9GAMM|nr:undecaprenyl-diphosphate phosphatase [Thiohalophilus thiocyanatoxydans]TDX98170.1 undecaprenyl-diphosphatase [Thiohalophilus thiocyanatoxydans]
MLLIQIIILAIIQGLTEFLPISSSAHLILVPQLSDWPDQGLAFDVAVHVGTLSAVVWYFRCEVITMARDWGSSCVQRQQTGESRLAWAVILGSIPVAVFGLLLHDLVDTTLRSPLVIAWATIGFGLLLWLADVIGRRVRDEHRLGWKDVVVIGLAQAVALIPGTSRSGITMTAGLLMGLTRTAAARFSFLLSIPAILMAGAYKTLKLIEQGSVEWLPLLLGAVISAFTAYLCIHWFLKLLDRIGMLPFVIYRLLLGAGLLYVFM